MKKINITTLSKNIIVKPLVTAFRSSLGEYIVLDNEVNGSMGLPIILVSKLTNNKLTKITDQNEWNSVKEILRNIISGNQMDYIDVDDKLNGDDIFFTQLTLPAASFEVLKGNYKPLSANPATPETSTPETSTPQMPTNPVSSVQPPVAPTPAVAPNVPPVAPVQQPVSPVQPPVAPTPAAVPNVPPVAPVQQPVSPVQPPVAPTPKAAPSIPPVANNQSVQNTQEPFVTPFAPTMDNNEPISGPVIQPAPVNNNVVTNTPTTPQQEIDYSTEKEAFLKACENMFDALVSKLNK